MLAAKQILGSRPKAQLLWASTRELLNIFHAEECGCDIITVPNEFLAKIDFVDKDLGRIFARNGAGCSIAMRRRRLIRSRPPASRRSERDRRLWNDRSQPRFSAGSRETSRRYFGKAGRRPLTASCNVSLSEVVLIEFSKAVQGQSQTILQSSGRFAAFPESQGCPISQKLRPRAVREEGTPSNASAAPL